MARGSWGITEAIVRRWDDDGLEAILTASWPVADRTSYSALNDDEARPGTPLPYCVLEQPPDGRLGGDSGIDGGVTAREYRDIRFTLIVYDRSKLAASRIAKRIAKSMERAPLPLQDDQSDRMIQLFRDVDSAERSEDKVHSWSLTYRAVVEGSVDTPYGSG